jgi:hypothetical protein
VTVQKNSGPVIDARKAARALKRAFEYAGLDHQNRDDRSRLFALTDEYFRPRPRRKAVGRPEGSAKWDSKELIMLFRHWQSALWKEGIDHFLLSGKVWIGSGKEWIERPRKHKEAVALLRKHFPNEYKDDKDRAIIRRLSAAMRWWDKWVKRQQEDLEKRFRRIIEAVGGPAQIIRLLDEAEKVDCVKVNFSVVLKDRHGNNIEELYRDGKPQPVTLGDICCDVLDVPQQGQQEEIIRRGKLIMAITNAKEPLAVLDSDAQMIKDRVLSSARIELEEVEAPEAVITN